LQKGQHGFTRDHYYMQEDIVKRAEEKEIELKELPCRDTSSCLLLQRKIMKEKVGSKESSMVLFKELKRLCI